MNKLERKYIAVSMKHSSKDSFLFWGYKRTQDNEDRCYSGYTAGEENIDIEQALNDCYEKNRKRANKEGDKL